MKSAPDAVGLDYNLHALDLALVDHEHVITADRVLVGEQYAWRADLEHALRSMALLHDFSGALYLEMPWLGKDNPQTVIKLALLVGNIECVALYAGFTVHLVAPSTWRSQVFSGGVLKRADAKAMAIWYASHVLHFETKSHDLADAVCIGYFGACVEKLTEVLA